MSSAALRRRGQASRGLLRKSFLSHSDRMVHAAAQFLSPMQLSPSTQDNGSAPISSWLTNSCSARRMSSADTERRFQPTVRSVSKALLVASSCSSTLTHPSGKRSLHTMRTTSLHVSAVGTGILRDVTLGPEQPWKRQPAHSPALYVGRPRAMRYVLVRLGESSRMAVVGMVMPLRHSTPGAVSSRCWSVWRRGRGSGRAPTTRRPLYTCMMHTSWR
mmetsp:Transcript_3804/g.13115  ORF Transcript_3804/g.13115 Transcript_3804/m.13115 type:complete len:217 (+) Transcript_3804:256-906(+)